MADTPAVSDRVEIRLLATADAPILDRVASGVFDLPLQPALVREFLEDPRHHLAAAIRGGEVIGIASAVHYIHPDKPAELFINEVGVAERHRGQGIGRMLLQALLSHGRQLGCAEAWVLADPANEVATRLYRTAGGGTPTRAAMFTFHLS